MNSDGLATTQAPALGVHAKTMLVYLGALLACMKRRGLRPDDQLYPRTIETLDKVHSRNVELPDARQARHGT
jgi:hypothetical protein